jgi:hypothetical protein
VNRVLFEALLKAESGLDIDASRVAEAAQSELEGARRKFEAQALTLLKTTDPKASDEDLERAVSAALRAIAADRPLDAHTLDALSRQATSETLAFARTAGLVTIPESLRVSTAVERGAVDGGALAASDAFFSPRTRVTTAVVKVSTPTAVLPAAAQEEWLSALSPSRLRILALAEGAPGLAVLRAAQSQNRSHIRRKLGCQGVDRGWADYARRIAVDAGYGANDTSVKLAGLSMDMVVAARALCAARIHAGTMTVTEARETFRRQALLPGEVANLEARRCASDPLVALELVGRKELERLVADVGAKRSLTLAGARDRILNTGPLPFETLRLVLLPARAD